MVVAPASFLVIRHLRPKLGWTAGDFGDRFWVYQIVDQRTDSFAQVGKMYGTKPGFYLLAGPNWNGTAPSGITGVFHAKTMLGVVIPRVFKDDTPEDTQAVQPIISKIIMYPLSKFTGQQQTGTGRKRRSSHRLRRVREKRSGSTPRPFSMNWLMY